MGMDRIASDSIIAHIRRIQPGDLGSSLALYSTYIQQVIDAHVSEDVCCGEELL